MLHHYNRASDLLASFGFDMPTDTHEQRTGESYEDQHEMLVETLGHALNSIFGQGEVTGGADWSSAHVWRVPRRLESYVRALPPIGAFYLIWDEGQLDDTLYFVDAWTDEGDNMATEEIDVELKPQLMRKLLQAAGRDPEHIKPYDRRQHPQRVRRPRY